MECIFVYKLLAIIVFGDHVIVAWRFGTAIIIGRYGGDTTIPRDRAVGVTNGAAGNDWQRGKKSTR